MADCIKAAPAYLLNVVCFLFIIAFFFFLISSCSDIGDKYSVFRQLEQPADKKPVGKKLTHSFLHIQISPCCQLFCLQLHVLNSEMAPVSATPSSGNTFFLGFNTVNRVGLVFPLIRLFVWTWLKLSAHRDAIVPCLHCTLFSKAAVLIQVCFPSLFH